MRNEPWVWPEVGDAGTSGAGAVPLRLAKMMGQQKKKKKKKTFWLDASHVTKSEVSSCSHVGKRNIRDCNSNTILSVKTDC